MYKISKPFLGAFFLVFKLYQVIVKSLANFNYVSANLKFNWILKVSIK